MGYGGDESLTERTFTIILEVLLPGLPEGYIITEINIAFILHSHLSDFTKNS